jgi:adenosylcobyric acid synthase
LTSSALLVCGTSSGSGKSTVVTALCRSLARRGVRVAPFKAQNMSNHSSVTLDGAEIGRAQYAQAQAAGIEPEALMNPVLLKPTGERTAQVVVSGRAVGFTSPLDWGDQARSLLPVALDALATLRSRFDIVVAEGAGSPAELNLLDRDIANLPLALAAGMPALLVADIDRGGVFASVAGTVAVLPPPLRDLLRGVVVNKLRGDPALFCDRGIPELERVSGLPVLGVLPWLDGPLLDEEDGLDLGAALGATTATGAALDIAVIGWPRLANATDFDPFLAEPGVTLRYVRSVADLGRPHLVVLGGTKATVADLGWLRATGLADAVAALADAGRTTVLGICGGLQVLGTEIVDDGVESGTGTVEGLGRLAVRTEFEAEKVVRRTAEGYEIRHGRVVPERLVHESDDGAWLGTTVHGAYDDDERRAGLLARVAGRAGVGWVPSGVRYAEVRRAHHDRLADWLDAAVDVDAVLAIAKDASGPAR